ncbi:hypothetical protein BDF19DRAFT_30511 [Syncephalis fuscata]|nr:hypothetical protein BDF19DRAFT_30511 [Syncephalis fuscata]
MKANALILARFKGTHLPGDAAPSPTMTGTVNMANETARVEDELQADASYCGTDDCNYCPPNEMASMNSASATPNINHPPPLPEFFQSASMDLNTYLSLEEEGERQDDEYVDEDDGTSQNERDENSVELSHPSFFEGNIENRLSSTHRSFHMSSPIMSSVNELLTIVSPKQTATTLVDEGIDDMMAMSPPSQSVLMSSPRTSGIYPKAFPILSNVSALPDKVAYNDHYNDHDDYNDGLRISNSMAPPAEVSSLISLPADIANIYHQLGFSETLDPPPITPRILRAIRTTLNPEQNNNDARFWGICLLGFYGMFSVDELPDPIFRDAIGSPLPIRFRKNIATLNKPVIDNPDCNELSLYLVSLPVNKTSKPGSDHNASVLCPNKAIHEWLSIEECGPPRQLAQYLLAGAISPTSKQWMEQRLQQALEETDLDEFHDFHYRENYQLDSLRFGGAVCAYEAGVKVDNIRLVGGWNNYNTIAKFELDSLANNLASHVNRCCL